MQPGKHGWHSFVDAPLCIASADQIAWDQEADLVVVGFGGAGATAALRAAQQGLSVVAVDKAEGGGATLASGGVVYAGGGTRIQKQFGEVDSPENMFAYLKLETGDVVGDNTLRRFCRHSAEHLDWLMEQGVAFGGPVCKEKTSYPNVDYFLYHSDNSLLPEYAKRARSAARGHRGVMRKGRSAVNLGGAIYLPLRSRCMQAGVSLLTKTEARRLVVDTEGRVLGVEALQIPTDSPAYAEHQACLRRGGWLANRYPFFLPGARAVHRRVARYFARAAEIEASARVTLRIRSKRGVCLSAGGFIFNRGMVEHHCPAFAAGVPLGTPADDGSGIRLGQSVGGAVASMDRATAWRFINPPLAWSQGIIVDDEGKRFVNESCYGATIGDAMVQRAGGKGWLILDNRLVRRAWRQIWPTKVLPFQWQLAALNMLFGKSKFRNLSSLCERFGFHAETLRTTLAQYRRVAAGEERDPFGKDQADAHHLSPPLHVIDVSVAARLFPCTVLTLGGLRVDEANGRVLNETGEAIEGLFAAGRNAVGIPSHLYVSGLSIADCVFSGMRVADTAAGQGADPVAA